MKFFLDFFPLLAFFITYYLTKQDYDIYPAVAVLMVAAVIQTLGHRLLSGKFQKMHVIMLLVALVFGSLTLLLRDDQFIKWKASVFVWAFGLSFLLRHWISGKLLIKETMETAAEEELEVPDKLWIQLNWFWAVSLIAMGFLNLWIAYNFSQEVWVNFKVWGLTILMFAMIIVSTIKLYPYFPQEEAEENDINNKE